MLESKEIVVGTVGGKSFDFNDPQDGAEDGNELDLEDGTVKTLGAYSLSSNNPRVGALNEEMSSGSKCVTGTTLGRCRP